MMGQGSSGMVCVGVSGGVQRREPCLTSDQVLEYNSLFYSMLYVPDLEYSIIKLANSKDEGTGIPVLGVLRVATCDRFACLVY